MHSKFAFLLHAMEWNPFRETGHWFWMDAGVSRFYLEGVDFAAPVNEKMWVAITHLWCGGHSQALV